MSEQDAVLRRRALLSLQRALFDEIGPALRAVYCNWGDGKITAYAYFDGEISEEDRESMSCAETEMLADFYPEVEIRFELKRCDYPNLIDNSDKMAAVYARRE